MRVIKTALLGLILFYCIPVSCWASIRIDKPKVRLTIAAGSYSSGEIRVENNGREPAVVKAYLEDWIYKDQNGEKEFMPKGTAPLSCSDWITFYPADFTVPVDGVQVVRYTVTVPDGSQGGHYSVLFFETGGGEMEKLDESGNVAIVKVLNRLGALFYVEPENSINKSSEIKKIDISQNLNKLTVVVDLLNTGNTDITTRGTFNVMDPQGYVYARGEFGEVFTLPNNNAQLRSVAPMTSLKAGNYDLLINLDYENGGVLIVEANFTVEPSGAIASLQMKK